MCWLLAVFAWLDKQLMQISADGTTLSSKLAAGTTTLRLPHFVIISEWLLKKKKRERNPNLHNTPEQQLTDLRVLKYM